MSKVIFITVRNYTKSTWLDSKLLQLTHTCQQWWADRKYETVIVDSYNDINQYLDLADWLVVQTAGDISLEQNHLSDKLHNIADDIGLIGHLVWYPEDQTPQLHPQCFILRTAAVRELNFDRILVNAVSFTKSREDMHHGHAPLEIFPSIVQKNIQYELGTSIMAQIHASGYRTINFDYDWRFGISEEHRIFPEVEIIRPILELHGIPRLPSRGFCFPELDTRGFELSLRNLKIMSPNLDNSQEIIILLFRAILDFTINSVVSILNWDFVPQLTRADTVICTAGGFLGEAIALETNAKSIVFYDINPHTVAFKQSLYTEWDGTNYFKYAEKWATDRNLIMEPKSTISQHNAASQSIDPIVDNWDYFKSLEVKFIHCDIISNTTAILDHITNDTLLHTSNILTYFLPTAIAYTTAEIDAVRKQINSKIIETNSHWSEI
jgi:hypothetical protein